MIVPMEERHIAQARALVDAVFPLKGPLEALYFFAWRRRKSPWVRAAARLFGIAALEDAWVDVDEKGAVRGIVGFYSTPRDEADARWLSWFCVSPAARGLGLGKALLDFAIETARGRGFRYLRLYTGSDPDEARAQVLYESRGLKEVLRRPSLDGYWRIYRELELA